MLRRAVVFAVSLSMGPSALASIFEASRTGEGRWSKLRAEGIHCGANHANRKARIAYENRKSTLAKRSVETRSVAHHKKASGVRAQ